MQSNHSGGLPKERSHCTSIAEIETIPSALNYPGHAVTMGSEFSSSLVLMYFSLSLFTADQSNFLSVGLINSVIYISIYMGNKQDHKLLRGKGQFDDNQWHDVKIQRSMQEVGGDKPSLQRCSQNDEFHGFSVHLP